ncbi:MAG: hypothetical protein Q4B16_08890 [Bacteroidia bacterium]|nr:hypothetical protein [Bacteroidia bacterium]
MYQKISSKCAALALLLGAGILLVQGCKVDDRYSLDNIKDVDTEVTVFENGLTIPLVQSTARITVDSVLRKAGVDDSSFGEYLKQEADGSYYLSYETLFSLKESIKELDLKSLVDVSAVDYSQSVSYELSSLDASSLKTEANFFASEETLEAVAFELDEFDPVKSNTPLLSREIVNGYAAEAAMAGQSSVTLPGLDLPVSDEGTGIKGAVLSDKIESIDEINMKAGSQIRVDVSLKGAIFDGGEIVPEVKIDLGDILELADGSVSLDCSSLVLTPANSFSAGKSFEVASLNASKIAEDREVGLSGNVVAKSLTASTSAAAALATDVEVQIEVSFVDFEIESVYGKLKDMTYSLDNDGETVTFDLPDEVSGFGAFTIIPKGDPTLFLSLELPEIDGVKIVSEEGATIMIPEFLKLDDVPSDFVYDEDAGMLFMQDLKSGNYSLKVDRIEVNPKKVDGKYVAEGRYAVKCTLGLPDERMDIYKLNGLDGQMFAIDCEIPAIEAGEVIVEELSIDVDEKSDISVVDASDIPDMVKRLGDVKLEGTYADVRLDLKNLPDIGDGKFYVDVTATLPEFFIPSSIDLKGEIKDGKFSRSVKVEKLDFSDIDIEALRRDGKKIGGYVLVSGCIRAEDPTVDVGKISQTISGDIVLKIAGADGKITIGDITAGVDYQIDSSLTVDFFKLPEALEDSYFDLPNAEFTAEVRSNLAIPMSAKLDLNEGMYDLDVEFPYSDEPSQVKTLVNKYSLDLNPLLSEGKDELPVQFRISIPENEDSHVRPDAEYDMDIDLGFKVPLTLGTGCAITYSDTLDISDNAETIAKILKNTAVQLFGTVENSMPFRVFVKVEFLSLTDGKYSVIPTAEPIESILAEASGKSGFSVNVNLVSNTGLDNLSHLRFSFSLGSDGSQLNSGDHILLEGIGIRVPQGVTVDVSD